MFQACGETVIISFTAVAKQLRSHLHIFIGYVSVHNDVPELLQQLNLTILACTSTGKAGKKAFQFYYLPAENWELRVERLRELHGRLKIYLRAEAVNISTTELQMTKEFLESRLPDPPC